MTTTGNGSPEYIVIVHGIARSKKAKSAPKYEQSVNEAAQKTIAQPMGGRDLSVDVRHFYTSGHAVDLDNLLKSVLDGLKGAAYHDDSQIVRVVAQRYNVSESFRLENPRPEWIEFLPPWAPPEDFVSVILSHIS